MEAFNLRLHWSPPLHCEPSFNSGGAPIPQNAVGVWDKAVSAAVQSDDWNIPGWKSVSGAAAPWEFLVNHLQLPSHRMGGFNVSSWLQLLLCIIWPWVELIFLSFKTDDKLELWMLFRERASVPLNVRKGQTQQEYHFIHPAIAQAKNRASSVYKCQMWETYELCFYFLWLLSIKSQTETSCPITNHPPSEKPGCTLQPWMQHPGQWWLFNCILIATSCCAWNMGSNRGKPGTDATWELCHIAERVTACGGGGGGGGLQGNWAGAKIK